MISWSALSTFSKTNNFKQKSSYLHFTSSSLFSLRASTQWPGEGGGGRIIYSVGDAVGLRGRTDERQLIYQHVLEVSQPKRGDSTSYIWPIVLAPGCCRAFENTVLKSHEDHPYTPWGRPASCPTPSPMWLTLLFALLVENCPFRRNKFFDSYPDFKSVFIV